MNSPFDLTSRAASVDSSSKNSLTWALFIPVDSAKWLITSDCVMRFLPVAALVAIVWCDTSNENLKIEKQTGHSYITLKAQSLQQNQHFSGIFCPFDAECRLRLTRISQVG